MLQGMHGCIVHIISCVRLARTQIIGNHIPIFTGNIKSRHQKIVIDCKTLNSIHFVPPAKNYYFLIRVPIPPVISPASLFNLVTRTERIADSPMKSIAASILGAMVPSPNSPAYQHPEVLQAFRLQDPSQ